MKYIFLPLAVCSLALGLLGFTGSREPVKATKAAVIQKKIGVNIGDIAPDIELYSPDSQVVYKLSSLRGKMVLIDFWASWCGPCRRENPNVVAAYDKYTRAKFKTAKGFEIFSVSLDKQGEPWKMAIAKDGLKWKYHVSELKGWGSKICKTYNVSSIPMSFLIDENGVIVAKNLRGLQLHTQLDTYVKSF